MDIERLCWERLHMCLDEVICWILGLEGGGVDEPV